jgi:hypothetical protein
MGRVVLLGARSDRPILRAGTSATAHAARRSVLLVAHCRLGLGKLHRRTGQREQAQEHLTTATTMYHEMDMRFWLEQAEVELKPLN